MMSPRKRSKLGNKSDFENHCLDIAELFMDKSYQKKRIEHILCGVECLNT